MKSGFQNAIGRSFLVVFVLMTLLAGNVQGVFAAPPSNDDFDDATLISETPFNDVVNDVVTTATPKSGEPANDDPSLGACNNNLAGLATVWYKFVAPASGILTVDTSGSGYNTVAAVWSGSRGSLTMVSCNNDYYDIVPNGTSYTNAYVLSGTTYYIEITQIGGVSGASALSAASDEVGSLAVADQLVLNVGFDAVPVVGVGSYDDADSNWSYSATGWTHASSVTGAYASTHSFNSTSGADTEFIFVGDQFTLFYTTASNGGQMNVYIDNNPINPPINEFTPTTQYQQTWTSQVLSPGAHRIRLERSSGTIYVDAIKITHKVAPVGAIGENYNPTYQWNQVPGATWYYLWINGPSSTLLNQWYQASDICNTDFCEVTPNIILGVGSHTWWVQTWNSVGYGPWSSAKNFTTAIPSIPSKPLQNDPTGNIGTNYNPAYSWDDVKATWYKLYVSGPDGVIINQWYTAAQTSCNGSTCSLTPSTTLGGGNYTWWVQPWNSTGYGEWSDGLAFNTTTPTIPINPMPTFPAGNIGTQYTPTYTWNDVSASWYELYVSGPSGVVIDQWYTSSQVACNGTTCAVKPGTVVGIGNFTWWVRPWNSAGYGPWSDGLSFTTVAPTIPGKASQTSPTGSIGTNYTPTYTWNDVSGTTWYLLYVSGPSGVEINQWVSSIQAACNGTTCSITPETPLGGGTHTWWVQTWNSVGYGPWSDGLSFDTDEPDIPGKPTQSNPNGNIGTNYNPTYTFSDAGGTWYYLWVNGPSGVIIKQWFTSAQASCNGTICSVTPSTSLGGGIHTWWVQPWNSAGYGQWSDGLAFSTTIPTLPGGVP